MSEQKKTFVITRFDPDKDEAPRQQSYEIPVEKNWKVLDALNYIKDEVDPTLSHRWSCRMAVCGSCGMMVDGKPSLTCKDSLDDYGDTVEVSPLANFPIIRDLVVELEGFLDKLKSVKPWIVKAKEKAVEEGTHRQSPAELEEFKKFSLFDSRDEGDAERQEIFRGEGTVFSCSYANECSEVCPKHVDPAAAVNQAKFRAVVDWATSFVTTRGGEG
jgi:fumarate reductase iron-sulfur subunit